MLYYYILINVFAAVLTAWDKWMAKLQKRRIPERTLMLCAALGGAFGVLAAMYTVRHKTRKPLFTIGVPLLAILHTAALIWLQMV